MVNNLKGWITCNSGTKIDIFKPKKNQIFIHDIAHALSRLCRFNGHIKQGIYSIAQHSVLVSQIVDQKWALEALMHDAAEAYLGDVVSPLKKHLAKYYEYEEVMERAIARVFRLKRNKECLQKVKFADMQALVTEARDLLRYKDSLHTYTKGIEPLAGIKIKPWGIEKSKREFLKRFHELYNGFYGVPQHDVKITLIPVESIWPIKMNFRQSSRTKKSAVLNG